MDSYTREGTVLWFHDLPVHPGVRVPGTADPGEPLLTVDRLPHVDPPEPDAEIAGWLDDTVVDADREPVPRTERRQAADDAEPATLLRLDDHPHVGEEFRRYLDVWRVWAEDQRRDEPTRALYGDLFSTYVAAAGHPDELELVVGSGLLAWRPEQHPDVRRHTPTTAVSISSDDGNGRLSVAVADSTGPTRVLVRQFGRTGGRYRAERQADIRDATDSTRSARRSGRVWTPSPASPSAMIHDAPREAGEREPSVLSPTLSSSRPRRGGDGMHSVFGYLTTENAALYREVMLAFVAAKRRFTVHLRPDDVLEALSRPVDPDAVGRALTALESWGNLRSDPDTSRVTTVEDFHRARFLYQLSREGEAAEEALAVYDEALGRRGALQAVALTDIAVQLQALHELAGDDEPDPAKVHLSLRALVDRFTDLAANAQAFIGSLQRSIDLQDVDAEAFLAYKDQLIDYLQRFVADLVATGSEIAELVGRIELSGVGRLLDLAARREAADAAPGGPEGGTYAADPQAVEFAHRSESWRERWAGFRGWFIGSSGHPSQAKLLRSQARAAIPQLLHVVAALNERRAGRSDRSADFRTLALWFAQAPDDDARHRLWRASFGLSSARHLSIDADTLAAREADPVEATTSWADAPPLQISPRLRRTGSYERRGKVTRVADRTELRRHLAELAAAEADELAAARAALATPGPIRLSSVRSLDDAGFRLFLGLLGDALAALTPGRHEVFTASSDGSMAIRLTALADVPEIELDTPGGRFRGPDHLVHIVDLTATGGTRERSA